MNKTDVREKEKKTFHYTQKQHEIKRKIHSIKSVPDFRVDQHEIIHVLTKFYSRFNEFVKIIKPFRPNPGQREKIKLNFYFNTSLWCLQRFYEGLTGLHKTFRGTTKKCEIKIQLNFYINTTSRHTREIKMLVKSRTQSQLKSENNLFS